MGEAVAFARVGGVSSDDPSSGKYSIVGEGGAVGPTDAGKTVAFARDGSVRKDEPFPGKYSLVAEGPITVVLIVVSVTNLETKKLEMCLLVAAPKPDPVSLKPWEEPDPIGSVWLVVLRYGYGAMIRVLVINDETTEEDVC